MSDEINYPLRFIGFYTESKRDNNRFLLHDSIYANPTGREKDERRVTLRLRSV